GGSTTWLNLNGVGQVQTHDSHDYSADEWPMRTAAKLWSPPPEGSLRLTRSATAGTVRLSARSRPRASSRHRADQRKQISNDRGSLVGAVDLEGHRRAARANVETQERAAPALEVDELGYQTELNAFLEDCDPRFAFTLQFLPSRKQRCADHGMSRLLIRRDAGQVTSDVHGLLPRCVP